MGGDCGKPSFLWILVHPQDYFVIFQGCWCHTKMQLSTTMNTKQGQLLIESGPSKLSSLGGGRGDNPRQDERVHRDAKCTARAAKAKGLMQASNGLHVLTTQVHSSLRFRQLPLRAGRDLSVLSFFPEMGFYFLLFCWLPIESAWELGHR